ncbi:MAG TPA: 3-hydroxy-3-methylglutaryl CoA synthase [Deltaproteobacteria bacterium]|jgi:3-hydroxy-3-methylglutaryl CoA synthase|nr:3-hydroxy-3-methylglutaryl CoA synthase [Deltaproteobacteria bacterium]
MIGITSYGAYVPATRLPLALIGGSRSEGGPEKAVASYDEDAITMGVAAATECLRGFDRAVVDAVFVGSTTLPYQEKLAASIVAKALDLRRDVATADYGGSLRAGASALRGALDAVAAGTARGALVVASDCRLAAPRSALERSVGDGAAAFLVGDAHCILACEALHAVADEILDVWRAAGDPFVHTWEERFVVEHGHRSVLVEAMRGLFQKTGLGPDDFARAALYAPDLASHQAAARAAGLATERLQSPLFGRLGNTGAAFAPMLLVAALEEARPGERLLFASYGDGAEASAWRTTAEIEKLGPRRAIHWHLDRRRAIRDYAAYLRARHLEAAEHDVRQGPAISATVHFRERDHDLSFHGVRCRRCGAEYFPSQRVCYNCHARDDFESIRLSDRPGWLLSWTLDHFFPTPEPPLAAGVVQIEGGARAYLQLTGVGSEELRCDLPLEFVFRRIHEVGGKPNYFWKATPSRNPRPEPQ